VGLRERGFSSGIENPCVAGSISAFPIQAIFREIQQKSGLFSCATIRAPSAHFQVTFQSRGIEWRYNASVKRFRRWLFNGVAAVSLLLTVASGVVWVRSYFIADLLKWHDGAELRRFSHNGTEEVFGGMYWKEYSLRCAYGGIQFYHGYYRFSGNIFSGQVDVRHYYRHDEDTLSDWPDISYPYYRSGGLYPRMTTDLRAMGFELTYIESDKRYEINHCVSVTVPMLVVFVAAGVLPILWSWREIKRRGQTVAGYCATCGYDLRAPPTAALSAEQFHRR
jgi:hypothetical protein